MANTYLSRTMNKSENTDSDKKFSYSAWIKRSSLSDACIIEGYYSSTFHSQLYFDSNANLTLNCASGTSGAAFQIVTNRKFRDTSAWYHIVVAIDTTQGTASDRAKIYINGVQETSFSGATYPNQNTSHQFNRNGNTAYLGRRTGGGVGLYFGGLMSHIHTTIGYTYDASAFGETDTTTGEWEAKTSPSVTYGTNGFFILKDGNSVTDQSGKGNNFTVSNGTLTNLKDNPDNVFATMNPLLQGDPSRNLTFSNGNTTITGGAATWHPCGSTIAAPAKTGKWYWEFSQFVSTQIFVGLMASNANINRNLPYQTPGLIQYFYAGRLTVDNSDTENYFTAISAQTDVVGVALDMTAGTYGQVQFYLNGSTTGAAVALTSNFADQFVMPFAMVNGTSRSISINTGNGYFGTTAVSTNSGNGYAGAEGASKFNYAVPSGYSALNTKGLNT